MSTHALIIRPGQRYAGAHTGEHRVCREHAATDRRPLGPVLDARMAGVCEVCVEDGCRETLARLHFGGTVRRREVHPAVLSVLLERGLVWEAFDHQYQATPRAEGYCATPSTFDA